MSYFLYTYDGDPLFSRLPDALAQPLINDGVLVVVEEYFCPAEVNCELCTASAQDHGITHGDTLTAVMCGHTLSIDTISEALRHAQRGYP